MYMRHLKKKNCSTISNVKNNLILIIIPSFTRFSLIKSIFGGEGGIEGVGISAGGKEKKARNKIISPLLILFTNFFPFYLHTFFF